MGFARCLLPPGSRLIWLKRTSKKFILNSAVAHPKPAAKPVWISRAPSPPKAYWRQVCRVSRRERELSPLSPGEKGRTPVTAHLIALELSPFSLGEKGRG